MKKLILFLFFPLVIYSQDSDITEALIAIDKGDLKTAAEVLEKYKRKNLSDPAILFLEACLTKDGEDALKKYTLFYEKYPKHKYSEEALYRIYSYYYSLGLYKKANDFLLKLKKEFPNSQFAKSIQKSISYESINNSDEEKKDLFIIQVGAFINYDYAKNLCDKLNNKGHASFITTKEIGGSVFNIVNCGKFNSEEAAKKTLEELEKSYNIKGRIIRLENIY
ncbi:MAG: SPOR domain-containing protein [Melioribacter sp.]|nr:SPOR domain-containing protein [Melioribacter sp.]